MNNPNKVNKETINIMNEKKFLKKKLKKLRTKISWVKRNFIHPITFSTFILKVRKKTLLFGCLSSVLKIQ